MKDILSVMSQLFFAFISCYAYYQTNRPHSGNRGACQPVNSVAAGTMIFYMLKRYSRVHVMVSVGQMPNRWLILAWSASLDAPPNPCLIFVHLQMNMISLIISEDCPRHCIAWLKERLVPAVAACSSLISMLHQISTEIQTSNENSGTRQWGGLVCHVPCHMKRQTTAKWWRMKGEAKGWGVLKPLWCSNNAETPLLSACQVDGKNPDCTSCCGNFKASKTPLESFDRNLCRRIEQIQ